jgi:leucyl/phenylalanyl-tRNA--protein transferase
MINPLKPEILLAAYCQGVFPMPDENDEIAFYDPDPRAIIPLDAFHVPRRLAQTIRNGGWEIRFDSAVPEVIAGCAETKAGRETTWINRDMQRAYLELFRLGYVHTVETWHAGQLVGGLYGVAIRGLFAGESMFSRKRDASKVALVALVERLRAGGFVLLDSQYIVGSHMLQFGTSEISRHDYQQRLFQALSVTAQW